MPRRALPLRRAVSVRPAVEEMAAVCDDTYVSEYMTVEERGTVQHLASRVVGRLRPGRGPLIRALEGRPRGASTPVPS